MTELFNVYSDLKDDQKNELLDKIISASTNEPNVLIHLLSNKNRGLKDSTYSYTPKISAYINIEASAVTAKDWCYSYTPMISDYINIPNYREEPAKLPHSFQVLQEWEGYISTVGKTHFTATLMDLTADDDIPNEEADFDLNDVKNEDQHFVKEGAVFRWVIGYYRSPYGSKRRSSEIVFRRMSQWTTQDINKANKKTEEFKNIVWE